MSQFLEPVQGCVVLRDPSIKGPLETDKVGVVQESSNGSATVRWKPSGVVSRVPVSALKTALQQKNVVEEVPFAKTHISRGLGEVISVRTLGGRQQVMVDFFENGDSAWVPHENLKRVEDAYQRFKRFPKLTPDHAERFRLKVLAYGLERWNANTGALSPLSLDPLPHQIHLVHHLLADGNLNWLIADDVGLGKTIEVGMLLAALRQRRGFERILIVTPAGLVKQWQEELREKFQMNDFVILGEEFNPSQPAHWKLQDKVIASIDRLKMQNHLNLALQSPPWALTIFDEAHKLTRREYGPTLRASERFRLAAALRPQSEHFLFLSATPHQGKNDQFKALIGLLRPEYENDLQSSHNVDPRLLSSCVFRNRKSEVTDADGQFIFFGQTPKTIEVPVSSDDRNFDAALQDYVAQGYKAAEKYAGNLRATIGFVMTVFRKLAASSPAAILAALERRLEKINEKIRVEHNSLENNSLLEQDDRFQGENEEMFIRQLGGQFFAEERAILDPLIQKTRTLLTQNSKQNAFLDHIITPIITAIPDEKVLIFTEYRATQGSLAKALAARFGTAKVLMLNGSLSLTEKREVVRRFNDEDVQFLLSTEAGGEGLNLHHRCHHLVNYDLPWNPMRLVQRVGRLYRYGQTRRVIVFNLLAPSTLDAHIVQVMYTRIDQIVRDLCHVSGEFNENMYLDIFGDLASMLEISDILEQAAATQESKTNEQITLAIQKAERARQLQEEIFREAQQFNAEELRHEMAFSIDHLQSFVESALKTLGCTLQDTTQNGRAWRFKLSEPLREELLRARIIGPRKHIIEVTIDRGYARKNKTYEMMDFGSALFKLIISKVKDYDFGGLHAIVYEEPMCDARALVSMRLRWQNDQGHFMREELLLASIYGDGSHTFNTPEHLNWLRTPSSNGQTHTGTLHEREDLLKAARQAAESRQGELSNRRLHPGQIQALAAAFVSASPADPTPNPPHQDPQNIHPQGDPSP